MKLIRAFIGLAGLVLAAGPPALAQAKLTITVDEVHSAQGNVMASLCSDPKGQFPGYCPPYMAVAPAKQGTVELVFPDVKPGTYAIQVFHDENGNNIPNIPPEGYAYGNNTAYPPAFDKSAVKVEGDTRTQVTMLYVQDQASFQSPKLGSKGAPAPAGVAKTDVRENGLYAEFYVPAHTKPLPTIILIGGSEGGLDIMSRMAPSFTRQGYAVLALAYFLEEGLPQTLENVPLEYFDKAVAWVKARPEVDGQRIGAIGGSRGSEAVLLLGSRNKDVHAVMAFAPSGLMWQGLNYSDFTTQRPAWTLGGKGLPFVPPDNAKYSPTSMRPMFESALSKGAPAGSEIEVEKINGPVLLLSGEADALWPSTPMANAVIARLKAKKFKHAFDHYSYPGAGHLVFMADPTGVPTNTGAGGGIALGGTPEANAKAWADNWPKTLKFFDAALKGAR
jgi:dienelactone hydrolase/uncharacterized protein (DUF2141 family)